jgi:hypothetical protein
VYIYVGRSKYEIVETGENITFQYRKKVRMNYGETKDLIAYLCGDGDATVSLSPINVTILEAWYDDRRIDFPFLARSTNATEHPLKVRIDALQPNSTGYLVYNLNIKDRRYVYKTMIEIGPTLTERGRGYNLIAAILVISALLVTVLYILRSR